MNTLMENIGLTSVAVSAISSRSRADIKGRETTFVISETLTYMLTINMFFVNNAN